VSDDEREAKASSTIKDNLLNSTYAKEKNLQQLSSYNQEVRRKISQQLRKVKSPVIILAKQSKVDKKIELWKEIVPTPSLSHVLISYSCHTPHASANLTHGIISYLHFPFQ
jgi:hypothetical protein